MCLACDRTHAPSTRFGNSAIDRSHASRSFARHTPRRIRPTIARGRTRHPSWGFRTDTDRNIRSRADAGYVFTAESAVRYRRQTSLIRVARADC